MWGSILFAWPYNLDWKTSRRNCWAVENGKSRIRTCPSPMGQLAARAEEGQPPPQQATQAQVAACESHSVGEAQAQAGWAKWARTLPYKSHNTASVGAELGLGAQQTRSGL